MQFSVITSLKIVKISLSKMKMKENNKFQNFIYTQKNTEETTDSNDTYTIEK